MEAKPTRDSGIIRDEKQKQKEKKKKKTRR